MVAPGDTVGLADALETMLFDATAWSQAVANVERVRATLTWERTLSPLVEFCAAPRRAVDATLDVVWFAVPCFRHGRCRGWPRARGWCCAAVGYGRSQIARPLSLGRARHEVA